MKELIRIVLYLCATVACGPLMAQGLASDAGVIYSTDNPQPAESGQAAVSYTIRHIYINGNNRTKEAVILRELPFTINESYALDYIVSRFRHSRQQLMNTGLFRNVVVSLRSISNHDVSIQVDVEEKWYFYPLPFVKVVDGRFQQWWSEKSRSMDRLNYGLRLTQYNATGRNDNLYLYLMNGYTKQVMLEYKGLSLDKELKWYGGFSFAHGKNREMNYMTAENKQVSVKDGSGYMRSFTSAAMDLSYRPAIKTRHTLSVGYHFDQMADTLNKLNANFTGTSSTLSYPKFAYSIFYNDVDFLAYPTRGIFGEASLAKFGLRPAVNMWQLTLKGNAAVPVGKKDFINLRAVGLLKLPFDQPYIRQQFIGYDDLFLQGYENYVIDGVAGGYAKLAYHHPLLNISIRPPRHALAEKFRLFNPVPLKVYAKAFVNTGYVHTKNFSDYNPLNNRMLYSAGVGLDVVAFADLIVKIEWSWNQLGQNGLYLHQRERY